jgi:TolB-like protein
MSRAHAKNLRCDWQWIPASGPDSIAVLPFTNVRGDANTDYLSDGITESLIGNLAHLPQLKVRSRDSVFRYKGKDVDVQTAGSNLNVSVLVSGRVMAQGDAVEISAELTDVRTTPKSGGIATPAREPTSSYCSSEWRRHCGKVAFHPQHCG